MKVACYGVQGGRRSKRIAQAMVEGLRRCGVEADFYARYDRVCADVAISYGWINRPIFRDYHTRGAQYVFWDLGYWARRSSTDGEDLGFHRVAVNSWDTADHVAAHRGYPGDRFKRLGIRMKAPRRPADEDVVVVAGMSGKAAWTHGYRDGEWEHGAIEYIKAHTQLPVIYRAKPNKSVRLPPIEEVLRGGVRLLYTHHSNAALDALIAGVPCWAKKGLGMLVCSAEPNFEKPYFPAEAERRQLMWDAAYAQWNLEEMRSGEAWDYIKKMLR